MNEQVLSWVLTVVGLTGFFLAGNKVWWAWYINIANQIVWVTYAIVAQEFAFLIGAGVYTVFFTRNAVKWTKEHRETQKYKNKGRNVLVEPTKETGLEVKLTFNDEDFVRQMRLAEARLTRGVNTDENELVDLDFGRPCGATVEFEDRLYRCHRFAHPTKLDHSSIIYHPVNRHRQILWDYSGVYAEMEL